MNRIEQTIVTLLLGLALGSMAREASAQSAVVRDSMYSLFEQALCAEGESYLFLRSNIVAHGAAVIPLLNEQAASTNLHRRVVASAMLSWISDGEKNEQRTTLLAALLVEASLLRSGMLKSVRSLSAGYRLGGGGKPVEYRDCLHEDAAVPFLLEVVLKGPSPAPQGLRESVISKLFGTKAQLASDTQPVVQDYDLWARCLAAGLVGSCKGADVYQVLGELLKNERVEIRACAAAGLRRARSIEAVELLLGALSDSEPFVQESAYRALMELTGQDFRKGLVMEKDPVVTADQIDDDVRKQFQEWWQQNKERLLSNPEVQK